MAGIGKFDAATSTFKGQSDLVVGQEMTDTDYTDTATLADVFATPKSLGQILNGSTEWGGDETSAENITDEQGDIIAATYTKGTNVISFSIASFSQNILKEFMKAEDIAGAFGDGGIFGTGAKAVGMTELPITTRGFLMANDKGDKCIVFPKAEIVASVTLQDGLWCVRGTATAQYIKTTNLQTVMEIEGADLDYAEGV